MNLLMLSGDSSVARGVDGAFYQMLSRFRQYWDRIDILTPAAPDAQSQVIHETVHVHPSPWHRALQPLFIRQKGAALLAEREYALVTSHDFGFFYNGLGAYWLLHAREDVPYVSEIHHVEGYPRAVTWRERLWRVAAMRYLPFVATQAAAIRVVNHQEVPDLLRRLGIPDSKILVLPSLYLDLSIFQPRNSETADRGYDVLFVGRLAANKGILTLLAAMRQVVRTHPAVTLAIRGDGPLRPQIASVIESDALQDNVHFLPRVTDTTDMARLYNQARMLVCASTVEGGPRVTVEAMACGVPVISTPVGIMPEIIRDGENGFLYEWDADTLADRIRRLLDSETLRRTMGDAGRDSVQGYTAERVIKQYAQGYHDLIARLQA